MTKSSRRALWLFPAALVLHNLEEAIWLPAWSQSAGAFHPPVEAPSFRFVLVVATLVGVFLTFMASRRGGGWLTACSGAWGVMLGNILMPHLLATLAQRRYAPGLATALLCTLPADGYLLWHAVSERQLRWRSFGIAMAVAVPLTLGGMAALLWVGDRLFPV